MQQTLIRTKLRPPFIRPNLVSRPQLQEQVERGLRGPLILVTAPAGFGKTTLAASSLAGCGLPVAWLSLDKEDNQQDRFLDYLAAALQQVLPGTGVEEASLTSMMQDPDGMLSGLLNDLEGSSREMVLVLDDYQAISSQAVHEKVTFLIEHCPRTLHLLIVTRSDPPLPISRLRARGQVVELRAADLRFTEVEAMEFLNHVMGLRLDASSVAALSERTEGWVTGLQMAALSLRERADIPEFIEQFSGTNRFILDYLLEEVLASQPPEIQCFLLCTSVLERLCAPLCEAVLEASQQEGGNASLADVQATLEHLERSNLFLAPLDDRRKWYRYHHLFADLLRTRLGQLYPGLSPRLHMRASQWHEQNGSILEAIHHASLAADEERVEQLIETNYLQISNRAEMASIRQWIGELSKELVYRRPWLCLYEAMNYCWFGHLDKALHMLEQAEKTIRSEAPSPETSTMQGYHDYVKSRIIAMIGDTRRAIDLCRAAREMIPASNLALKIDLNITLGFEYFLIGEYNNAEKTLKEMIQVGQDTRATNNSVAGYALLARQRVYQGRLHESEEMLRNGDRLVQEGNGQYRGVTGLLHAGKALLSCEWNDLASALAYARLALELLPQWGKVDDVCLVLVTLARIQAALGDKAAAADAVENAVRLVKNGGVFSEARGAVEAAQVRLWLVQEDWPAVERWMAGREGGIFENENLRYEQELLCIVQARAWIARAMPDEAIRLLSGLEESARAGGRGGRLVEILVLKALAFQTAGDPHQALAVLAESLALGEPEGYLRIFLDEGQPMHELFLKALPGNLPVPLRRYAAHIASLFAEEQPAAAKSTNRALRDGVLVEPLSRRELEVLELLARGQTNQEIARHFFLSPGTVKAHTASIFRKLDVANRTEAAARARELGLLT